MFHLCPERWDGSKPANSNSPNGSQLHSSQSIEAHVCIYCNGTVPFFYFVAKTCIRTALHCIPPNVLHKKVGRRQCNVRHARTAYLIPHHPLFMLGSMDKSVESRHCHWKIVNSKGANSAECSPLTFIVVLATPGHQPR